MSGTHSTKKQCGRTSWEPMPLEDGCLGVPLTGGAIAIIDKEDLPLVKDRCWSLSRRKGRGGRYATAGGPRKNGRSTKKILMHRLILGVKDGEQIDHRDRDGLNNRRSNLRISTVQQNMWNAFKGKGSSRFQGVSWSKEQKKWVAQIRINGINTRLGSFASEEEAARAYDRAARKYRGEFAYVNFPEQRDDLTA